MYKNKYHKLIGLCSICVAIASCKVPAINPLPAQQSLPEVYTSATDRANMATKQWRTLFTDPNLASLIDTALKNNQELMITLQEVEIARNEIRIKQGQLLPTVEAKVGAGVEKVGRYTSQGAGDASTEIKPGKEMPDPLTDLGIGIHAKWEVDIWKKLRNAKKAAIARYLSTVEGKNFVLTGLIAEVANTYYELVALDNQLDLVKQNIDLQKKALEITKIQKEATRVTELAVQKFRAEVLNSQGLEFQILQQIKETENRMNLLLGSYPQEIKRRKENFLSLVPASVQSGIPSELLANRADIKKAELALSAAKLDVKVARAEFYPSLSISSSFGFQAFNPAYLIKAPESIFYSLVGDLAGPLINRNGIKAEFNMANARQLQSLYDYQRTILSAYVEVVTELTRLNNLEKSYQLKAEEVSVLDHAIDTSNDLFKSARADYFEVLMTQRDALTSKLELIETKKKQLLAVTNLYRELGGGWQ